MVRSLLLCLAITTSFSVLSQHEYLEEKTPRFLVVSKVEMIYNPIFIDSSFRLPPYPYPDPDPYPYPFPDPFPWDIYPTLIYFVAPNLCGDRFYDNGNLRSRCACDADSVLQGKSVFWEENGRISSVEYYSKGKVYTRKSYNEGRVTELCNYTYKNDEQLLHGEHIEYSSDGKTIGKYAFGKKTGPHTTFTNGIKTSVTTYKDDVIIREEKFESDGSLYALSKYNDSGQPIGESYSYMQNREIKVVTAFENGKEKSVKRFKLGILVEHEEFNQKNELVLRSNFYANGEPFRLFQIDSDGAKINKEWNEDGILITDYVIENYKLVRTGFYTSNKTTTRFEQKFNSDGTDYLECWVIVSGDTTEFYYARNEGGGFNNVIAKNRFVQLNGRAVKTGTWITYENNQLISEINYSQGTKHGKAVYYDTTGSEPIPYLVGNFHQDMRNGRWTLRNDTLVIESTYHAGSLNGAHYVSSRTADTTFLVNLSQLPQDKRSIIENFKPIVHCSFKNGLLNDKFTLFWENGKSHIEGNYKDGALCYWFRAFNPDGSLYRTGQFTDGEPSGKWYLRSKKKNGKTKNKKERGPIVLPDLSIPLIETIRPEFLELTGGQELI